MRIYTRKGDRGETGLFGGGRVPKTNPRVAAYGDIDELNATLGFAVTFLLDASVRKQIETIQADLFSIGAHLATPPPAEGRKAPELPPLPEARVQEMEAAIDRAMDQLPELRAFILPGGAPGAAALHLARTVCRRAERRVVALADDEKIEESILVYLNRLSDLLFALARLENKRADREDRVWDSGRNSKRGDQ